MIQDVCRKLTEKFIVENYGDRCPTHCGFCSCCQKWDTFDALFDEDELANQWIEYTEPHEIGDHCVIRLTKRQAISHQQAVAAKVNHIYADGQAALDDFMVVHFAYDSEYLSHRKDPLAPPCDARFS